MRKIILTLFTACAICAGASAQKTVYDDNVEKRPISSFHGIEGSSGIEVIISKGAHEELAVSAGNNAYMDEVRTVVEGGILRIYRDTDRQRRSKWKNWKVKVYVSYNNLDILKANSGASISCSDLNTEKLTAKMSSGGSFSLGGAVGSLDVDGSSGAQFHGYGLNAKLCKAEVSSGAGIQITVDKEISARANSGGFVRFRGGGLIRDINVNSGGSVKRG